MLRALPHENHGRPAPAGHAEPLVQLAGLAATVARIPVLERVDLTVRAGETVGLHGANGCGKTTLLAVLATLRPPAAGRGRVLGAALGTRAVHAVRPQIVMVGHSPALYPQLTVRENLHLLARLAGAAPALADEVLHAVGLAGAATRRGQECSQGMLRRADLARVLLVRPSVLLLDEPHAGLDAASVGLVGSVVDDVRRRGGATVLVSHEPVWLAAVTDRRLELVNGRLVDREQVSSAAEPA